MENSEQTTTQTTANTQGQTQAPAVDNAWISFLCC